MSALAPAAEPRVSHPATKSQLDWLATQLALWQAEGLLDEDQTDRISGRYRADHRFSLARLLLTLGAVFVGIGVIWLVAANIAGLSPTIRLRSPSALFWLACLGASRRTAPGGVCRSSPLVGAVRLMAALAFGAVIFQAAQSLQVPAYEPALVGCWALGALVHAYAVRAVLPLVVAILAGTTWFLWAGAPGSGQRACRRGLSGDRGRRGCGRGRAPHRTGRSSRRPGGRSARLLLLGGLFISALPFVESRDFVWTTPSSRWLTLAAALAAAGLLTA